MINEENINNLGLKAVIIKNHTEEYKKAKNTLMTAFPKREQSPLWALRIMTKHQGVDFLAYYNYEGNYIGTSYSLHENGKLMILYLATDENVRGKGYGTKIIRYLQNKDNIQETVLDIESPYEESDNPEQRKRRLGFYQRLGFYSSEQEIIEPECHYLILGTTQDKQKSVNTYTDLTAKLTSNLCRLHIEKVH